MLLQQGEEFHFLFFNHRTDELLFIWVVNCVLHLVISVSLLVGVNT